MTDFGSARVGAKTRSIHASANTPAFIFLMHVHTMIVAALA